MYSTFEQIEAAILASGIKKVVALAGAHDSYALDAVLEATRNNLIEAVLIGHEVEIRSLLEKGGEDPAKFQIIDCDDDKEMTKIAVRLIHEGKADIPMKGLLQTSDYMRPILDKEAGLLQPGGLISQATLFEFEQEGRFFLLGDCAINIAPDTEHKKQIIKNTIALMHKLGIEQPKIACLSAVEIVNPKIPSTVQADELKRACAAGEFGNAIVAGPLAFDNAISSVAAEHKGINDPVAGRADFLLCPDLCTGNALTKAISFFSNMKSAGVLLGTSAPLISASRTDTPENKYRAILLGLLLSL